MKSNVISIALLVLGSDFVSVVSGLKISLSASIDDGYHCHQDLAPDHLCDVYAEIKYSVDPYFYYTLGESVVLANEHQPVWPEVWTLPNDTIALRFEVWDHDYGDIDDFLGTCLTSVNTLLNPIYNGTLTLILNDGTGQGYRFGFLRIHVVEP